MELTYTEEQQLFRSSVREFVTDRLLPERLAEIADGADGWDPALWKEACGLGLAGISVSEEQGGAGMGFVEEAIAAEELGRGVFPGPWIGSVILAQPALAASPELLSAVASGERIATVDLGTNSLVPDLPAADVIVTVRKNEVGVTDKDRVEWHMEETVDGTRRLGTIEYPEGTNDSLATGDEAKRIAAAIRTRGLAALAAEATGVAERVMEIAVQYAKEREQFGSPIGKYQAVSHQLADTYMDVELTKSLSLWAAVALEDRDEDAGLAAETAKQFAADAAVRACERAIQVHGGIGFTWEHPLHRFYKRALWIRAFLASGEGLRASISGRLLA
ncbi:MAG: acyl-CoA/acyl-ACP dehydrogenase [Actinobacteria bacterium]|nr:acyl-CoA/acyl-ACP dehydrogenase [Actinomycetota bacterium]